jgi:formamidopyrimidine-DNA glycosylase
MPELPEVEVTRRGLEAPLTGATIASLRMGKPLRWPLGIAPQMLQGAVIASVQRRAKYVVLQLGNDRGVLLLHLGMSGRLEWLMNPVAPGAHDHVDIITDRGLLRLHDPRRFGAVVWSASTAVPPASKLLGHLGVEPLTDAFTADGFWAALKAARAPIKPVLLAGHLVVGVGNIYACEALFEAGIRPTVRAERLSRPRVARLHAAIQRILTLAIAQGGSSLKDFAAVDGQAGGFQKIVQVYGRAGKPCRVCAEPIQVMRQAQRATYYCSRCQCF